MVCNARVKCVNVINVPPLKLELKLEDNSNIRTFTMNLNHLDELIILYKILGFNDFNMINIDKIPVYIRIDIDDNSDRITKIKHVINDSIELYEGYIKDYDITHQKYIELKKSYNELNESYNELQKHKLALINDYNKYKSLYEDASALISKLKYKFPDIRNYCEECNINKIESDKTESNNVDLSDCLSEESNGQMMFDTENYKDDYISDNYDVIVHKKCKIELIKDSILMTIIPTRKIMGSKEPIKFILSGDIFNIIKNYSWRFTSSKDGKLCLYFVPGKYSSGNHEIGLGQLCYGIGKYKMIFTEIHDRQFVVSTPGNIPVLEGTKFDENKKELINKYGEF